MSTLMSIAAINIILDLNNRNTKVCSYHETPIIPYDPNNNDGFEFDMQNLFIVYKKDSNYVCRVYNSFTIPGAGCQPNYLTVYRYQLPHNMKISSIDQLKGFTRF